MKAVAVAAPTITLIVVGLFFVSYILSILLGLPFSLGFPLAARVAGGVLVVAGLALAGWVFRSRSPLTMLLSTYVTFTKLFGRAPMAERAGRTEPLVVAGPQRYVRNPLYLGVVVMAFGWALLGAYTYVLIGAVAMLLWFVLVLIPFEERELGVLFGEQYERYASEVPMLIPFTKRRGRLKRE